MCYSFNSGVFKDNALMMVCHRLMADGAIGFQNTVNAASRVGEELCIKPAHAQIQGIITCFLGKKSVEAFAGFGF